MQLIEYLNISSILLNIIYDFIKKNHFIVYLNSIYNNDKINKKFIYKYVLLRDQAIYI